jgi:hypothetical protein
LEGSALTAAKKLWLTAPQIIFAKRLIFTQARINGLPKLAYQNALMLGIFQKNVPTRQNPSIW